MSRATCRSIQTMVDPKSGETVTRPRKHGKPVSRDGTPLYEPCHHVTRSEDRPLGVRCENRRVKRGLCAEHLRVRDAIATFNREHATRRVVKRWAKKHLVRLGQLTGRQWVRFRKVPANRAQLEKLVKAITKTRAIQRPTPALS